MRLQYSSVNINVKVIVQVQLELGYAKHVVLLCNGACC
jgi:hypothetical protein